MGEAKRRRQTGEAARSSTHGARDWQRLDIPNATVKICIHMDIGDSGDIAMSAFDLVNLCQYYDRNLPPIQSHEDALEGLSALRSVLAQTSIETAERDWSKCATMMLWAALRRGSAEEYDLMINQLQRTKVFAYYIVGLASPEGTKMLTFGMDDVIPWQQLPAALAEVEQRWNALRAQTRH